MGNLASKYFDMDGKITSREFILRYIVLVLYIFILGVIREVYNGVILELLRKGVEINTTLLIILTIILVILAILGFVSGVSLQIRRLNDLKKSTALVILSFIPIVNIVYLIYLVTARSKQDIRTQFSSIDKGDNEIFNLNNDESNITRTSIGVNNEIELNQLEIYKTGENSSESKDEEYEYVDQDKKGRLSTNKMAIIILTVGTLVLSVVYYNFLYYPHNGKWETIYEDRPVRMYLKNGEGELRFYYSKQGLAISDSYDVTIFNPKRKNTDIGINGYTHGVKVNEDSIIIDFRILRREESHIDEELYFNRIQ